MTERFVRWPANPSIGFGERVISQAPENPRAGSSNLPTGAPVWMQDGNGYGLGYGYGGDDLRAVASDHDGADAVIQRLTP